MKKLGVFVLFAVLCLALLSAPVFAEGIEVNYGGGSGEFVMTMDTVPFINNGRTFLPIRFVAETFGIYTTWDGTTRTVTLERGTTIVRVTIDSTTMELVKDGVKSTVKMDVAPMVRDGRTCLPIRFIAEAFGLNVKSQEIEGPGLQVTISEQYNPNIEDGKRIFLRIGSQDIVLVGGYFLDHFYEKDDFRFAYPGFPTPELNESKANEVSIYIPPGLWATQENTITATYEPVVGKPFADMNLGTVLNYIQDQIASIYTTVIEDNYTYTTVNGIPAVRYNSLVVIDSSGVIADGSGVRYINGVALFHKNKLMRFEVATRGFYYAIANRYVLNGLSLDELLPTLTMK